MPPPRKKRKRNVDLNRSAVSMDDLNRGSSDCLSKSTISLPDKCSSDTLDSRSSSSTLVVTPILESRIDHGSVGKNEENKENIKNNLEHKIEEEDEEEDDDVADQPEIIPFEKETLFTSRTLLHSNLGYVDKLSAISEVSAESGFDDKTDVLKTSEGSGSVTSVDSVPRETGLNILAHIHDINNVSQIKESVDMREKTAVSKKEWLQNILKVDPEPYFMSRDASKEYRRGSDGITIPGISATDTGQPNSLPSHLHLMNQETQTFAVEILNKPSPSTPVHPHPENDANHSVLLDIIQKDKEAEKEAKTPNFLDHREESIFLTNTKTNIIYKSLSSDKLTDDYDNSYSDLRAKTIPRLSNSVNERHNSAGGDNQLNSISKSYLSDYSFQTPKLVESDSGLNSLMEDKRSNIVSSFDFEVIKNNTNHETDLPSLNSSSKGPCDTVLNGVVDSLQTGRSSGIGLGESKHNDKPNTKETLAKKDSISSSRKSSITDSLHEFEMSIYDMLKESKKNENSSDEEDSLKTVK